MSFVSRVLRRALQVRGAPPDCASKRRNAGGWRRATRVATRALLHYFLSPLLSASPMSLIDLRASSSAAAISTNPCVTPS